MQNTPTGQKPVRFIETPDTLNDCLLDLNTYDTLALDLEFDSHNNAYGVTLCLIQVATPNACYVIDPFAEIDLTPLYALFEDDKIQKIVHSPGEDLRLLHSLSCYPKNVFDTEIVARLLNYEQTSISVMLQEKLGHTMSKQQQKSNWLRRPLSPEQISYAADDVAYLHTLKAALVNEAEPKGLMPFVLEEQAGLSTTIYKIEAKESFLKPADFYSLSPKDQFILNSLFKFRDDIARQLNKPAYHIMDEPMVRDLATGHLQPAALKHAKSVHRNLKNDEFIDKISDFIEDINAAAQEKGLSDRLPAREHLTQAQYAAKEKSSRDKTYKFLPLQQALAEKMGLYAGRFMFSNSVVSDLLSHKISLSGLKAYRKKILLDLAQESGIDLSEYE